MEIKGKRKINDKTYNNIYFIEYDKKLFEYLFPHKKGVKMNKYKLTNVGKYSMTSNYYANKIAKILFEYINKNNLDKYNLTITDATANMGGDVMAFTNYFNKVNAVEIENIHCQVLGNNLKNYKVLDKVKIFCDDYLKIYKDIKQDIVYFDPPWGGKDYKKKDKIDLFLSKINIIDIVKELLDDNIYVALKVPIKYNIKPLIKVAKSHKIYKLYKKNGKIIFYLIILHN
jgi:predicted RNA methylase